MSGSTVAWWSSCGFTRVLGHCFKPTQITFSAGKQGRCVTTYWREAGCNEMLYFTQYVFSFSFCFFFAKYLKIYAFRKKCFSFCVICHHFNNCHGCFFLSWSTWSHCFTCHETPCESQGPSLPHVPLVTKLSEEKCVSLRLSWKSSHLPFWFVILPSLNNRRKPQNCGYFM